MFYWLRATCNQAILPYSLTLDFYFNSRFYLKSADVIRYVFYRKQKNKHGDSVLCVSILPSIPVSAVGWLNVALGWVASPSGSDVSW